MLRRRGGYAAAMWRLCGVAVAAMRRRLSAMLRPVRRRLCGVYAMMRDEQLPGDEAAASIDAAAGGVSRMKFSVYLCARERK